MKINYYIIIPLLILIVILFIALTESDYPMIIVESSIPIEPTTTSIQTHVNKIN
jgi:hypothetical protein